MAEIAMPGGGQLVGRLLTTPQQTLADFLAPGRVLTADVVSVFQERAVLALARGVLLEVRLQRPLAEGARVRLQVAGHQPAPQGKGEATTITLRLLGAAPGAASGSTAATAQPTAATTQAQSASQTAAQAQGAPPQGASIAATQAGAPTGSTPTSPQPGAPAPQAGPAATTAPSQSVPPGNTAAGRAAPPTAPTSDVPAGRPAVPPPPLPMTYGPPTGWAPAPTDPSAPLPRTPQPTVPGGDQQQAPTAAQQSLASAPSAQTAPPTTPTLAQAPVSQGAQPVPADPGAMLTPRPNGPEAAPAPVPAPPTEQAARTLATAAQQAAPPSVIQQAAAAVQADGVSWIPIPLPGGQQGWAQITAEEDTATRSKGRERTHQIRIWWETPRLGAVQVLLDTLSEGRLIGLFTVPAATARTSIETRLPELVESLAQAGFPAAQLGARPPQPGQPVQPESRSGRLDRRA